MGKKKKKVVVSLTLSPQQAAMLTHATCQLYHDMKAAKKEEIYGALIVNENVLVAREVWRMVESQTKIEGWE